MRRFLAGLITFLAFTTCVLVLPVYASPQPEAEPVETSSDQVDMGSVADPAPVADVQAGTTEPVAGVPAAAPALTVRQTDTAAFSLVGITWAPDPAVTDVVVQVRVQGEDGAWGGWTQVSTEDGDQEEGTDSGAESRGGTAPLWTGPSTGVEAELVTRAGAAPTDVTLDLVDPGTSDADDSLGSPDIQDIADAAADMPEVYSRAQWGADESIRTWDPEYAPTIVAATLHHTADTNDYTADQVPAMMRSIYRYHTVSRGWGDIGYNVIADKYGRLWEGRYGGLASTVVGAHAGGFNTGTFGVSMLGNYDAVQAPQAMIDSVEAIIAWKFALYGVDPRGTVTLTSGGGGTAKYSAGTRVPLPTIFGHRDVGSTTCPGQYGYARLPEIRAGVSAQIGSYTSPIQQYYDGDASVRSSIGSPVDVERTAPDGIGRYRHYQRGTVFWSPAGGVHGVVGAIRASWGATGWESGYLGYPVSEMSCPTSAGCRQDFGRGSITWTPGAGAHPISGGVAAAWRAAGAERGTLGYATADMTCNLAGGGCVQAFESGSLYWSGPTGAHAVSGGIAAAWQAQGAETGSLGYPTGSVTCRTAAVDCTQAFQGGLLAAATTTSVATSVRGGIAAAWMAAGGTRSVIGLPTAEMTCTLAGGGCGQSFTGGSVVWSPATGARIVTTSMVDAWVAAGGESGSLGYPVADTQCGLVAGGCRQSFQGGTLSWSPGTGGFAVAGGIRALWVAQQSESGPLGYPTAAMDCAVAGGGCIQRFQHATVAWSPAKGVRTVAGAIGAVWADQDGVSGALGYPSTDMGCGFRRGGCGQQFQGGSVYWSPTTGAAAVQGAIRTAWMAQGWENGVLGYPTTAMTCAAWAGVCEQSFEGGQLRWSAATGRVTRA